jgi:hypothetical protein
MTNDPLVPLDVARLDEPRMAAGFASIAVESREIGGGEMCRTGPGSWCNAAIGLGFQGEVAGGLLDEVIEYFVSKGIEPRVEVNPCADDSLIQRLSERGFVIRMFENTLARRLSTASPVLPIFPEPAGLTIERVDPRDDAAVRHFAIVATSGFVPEGEAVNPHDLAASEKIVRAERTACYLARINGEPAGAGSMEVALPVATPTGEQRLCAMFGTSVLPAFRRRGVQQHLLARRMNDASAQGATVAIIGSKPGVATERNVLRMGFGVMYTRVVLVRPTAGCTPGPA